jgi:hypothetical protein
LDGEEGLDNAVFRYRNLKLFDHLVVVPLVKFSEQMTVVLAVWLP